MKIFMVTFLLTFFTFISYSQVTVPSESLKALEQSVYGIGLSAGISSGFGLSFRHHLPSNLSYQIVGGVIKIDKDVYYNIGSEVQYDFVRGHSIRFFGVGSLGYFYSGELKNKLKGPFRMGLGIGGEFRVLEPLNITPELLFTYFSDGNILPLPHLAIHYYFF